MLDELVVWYFQIMERLPTHGIEVFLAIVREGSLRAAAEALGVGPPAVTLQLQALEEHLGIGLLFRTNRGIELTEPGRVLFDAAAPAHRDLGYAIKKTREMAKSTTGTLRLSLSRQAYIAALAPVLRDYLAENPGIRLNISWDEEPVDLVRQGIHGGIRMGDVLAPDMVAVRITPPITSAFFAAPAYLQSHGVPKRPRDLLTHQCIRQRLPASPTQLDWWVSEDGQDKRLDPPGRLTFDSAAGVIQAARDGHGVGWSARATLEEHIVSGDLTPLLERYAKDLPPYYIYYPEQNRRVECLKLLVEFLRLKLKTKPKS